ARRRLVPGPAEKDVARRLHHALAFDHAAALMPGEFRREPLEHGLAGLLDLEKQRRAVAAREQADRAEGADAAHAHHLEGDVSERIALDQAVPLGRQALLIRREHALGIDALARVALVCEMIDERPAIFD